MAKKIQPKPQPPAIRGATAGVRAGLPMPNALRGANVGKTIGKGTPPPKKKK